MTAPQTEQEFKLAISNACTYLRSFKDECIQLADQNLDNLFEYLRKMMDPQLVCEQTGYCIKEYDQTRPRETIADIAGTNINLACVPFSLECFIYLTCAVRN